MLRKNWTVSIGDWNCKRDDCHSEKHFSSSRHAHAFMWAKAHCEVKEACWISAGIDGWDSNHILAGKPFPENLERIIKRYIADEDALERLAQGIELPVEVHPTRNGNFLAYCTPMRCELVIKDVSELYRLADEYAGIMEAEYGMPENSLNVTVKVSYGSAVTY